MRRRERKQLLEQGHRRLRVGMHGSAEGPAKRRGCGKDGMANGCMPVGLLPWTYKNVGGPHAGAVVGWWWMERKTAQCLLPSDLSASAKPSCTPGDDGG
jgi:hypothetical protein